jgi:hypothetical protein
LTKVAWFGQQSPESDNSGWIPAAVDGFQQQWLGFN